MEELINNLSNNFTQIIHINNIKSNPLISWGNNGIGDRFANKKYNYSVIYANKTTKLYSENINDNIPQNLLDEFYELNNVRKGICGIFIHSKRENIITRPIKSEIINTVKKQACVCCGSKASIVCDHKNDLYNDERVLKYDTQTLEDFQALCNHCNLQKRQICKEEKETLKIYSAKNIAIFKTFPFEFAWEKKSYDVNCIGTKLDTYWYDPIEFHKKCLQYYLYVYPILKSIKKFYKD